MQEYAETAKPGPGVHLPSAEATRITLSVDTADSMEVSILTTHKKQQTHHFLASSTLLPGMQMATGLPANRATTNTPLRALLFEFQELGSLIHANNERQPKDSLRLGQVII